MAALDAAVVGGRVVIPPLGTFDVDLGIAGGRIARIAERGSVGDAARVVDAAGKVVLPGVIDPHTHIGYESHRGMPLDALAEQFDTESVSALVGGVTTVIDTYRNPEPYLGIFDEMRSAGEDCSRVDFSFNLGILSDAHREQIPRYHADLGITSFKFYMAYRGTDAAASGNTANRYTDALLYESMLDIARLPGAMAMVHAENVDLCEALRARLVAAGREDLAAWTESRPDFAEAEAVRRACFLAEQAGCPLYVPHVSSAKALAACLEQRARRTVPVLVEVCAHHLTHTKHAGAGIVAKVNPPLREPADHDALWAALAGGDADTVGSDHAPLRVEDKQPSIWAGGPGLPGVSTVLPVLVEGVHAGRLTLDDVAVLSSYRTARAFRLYPRKGTLMVGSDADLSVVDLDAAREVTPDALRSRADFTLYDGRTMRGFPELTMVRGVVAMEAGEVAVDPGHGRFLARR